MDHRSSFRPLTMNGFTQFAAPLSVAPVMYGPPPYGVRPVSFAEPEALERELGQTMIPAEAAAWMRRADLFGVLLGLGAMGAGVYMGLQPGPQTVKHYLAPGAAALAGIALLVKSV
jgi:hypothetical protein